MTPNDRKVALEKHNDARRQIAEGYPTRGDMVGIPPAANMNRLVSLDILKYDHMPSF